MKNSLKIKVNSLEETKKLAQAFASTLTKDGLFVTLVGDLGAGKTQFVRYILEALKVKDKITSPSFVILNEYKCDMFPIYHFDLYRLEEKGLNSIVPELRQYSNTGILTFIEWAEFGLGEIPSNALKVNIEYDENNLDIRWFSFSSDDNDIKKFISDFSRKVEL